MEYYLLCAGFSVPNVLTVQATQVSKSGGGETRLGTWGEWVEDDEHPRYTAMKYSNGQGCWNGPNRSTLVSNYMTSNETNGRALVWELLN